MSPAKLFASMKERENKREQQKVDKVSSSTRELADVGECIMTWKESDRAKTKCVHWP